MGLQEGARKSTCASFAFSSRNVYNVQSINITVLQSKVKTCYTACSKGGKTEWPRHVNQAFIPDKLGLPVKVEFLGIACRPSSTSGIDFGRTSRRLLLRRLMASYKRSIRKFSHRKPILTSYCLVMPTDACEAKDRYILRTYHLSNMKIITIGYALKRLISKDLGRHKSATLSPIGYRVSAALVSLKPRYFSSHALI